MDQARYDRGLKMRRQVLGDAYVDRALGDVDDFNRDFQRLITECAWANPGVTTPSSPASARSWCWA